MGKGGMMWLCKYIPGSRLGQYGHIYIYQYEQSNGIRARDERATEKKTFTEP